jgi:hypothetical protein
MIARLTEAGGEKSFEKKEKSDCKGILASNTDEMLTGGSTLANTKEINLNCCSALNLTWY